MSKFLFFCVVLVAQLSFAQEKSPLTITAKLGEVKSIILKNYKIEEGFLDTACIKTVVVVKFKIVDSRIDSLEFTKATPLPIKRAIENSLTLDKRGPIITDGKYYKNRTILIPIVFMYSSGCKLPLSSISVNKDGQISISKNLRNSDIAIAIRDFLDFESGDKPLIDCVLLSPMYFTRL